MTTARRRDQRAWTVEWLSSSFLFWRRIYTSVGQTHVNFDAIDHQAMISETIETDSSRSCSPPHTTIDLQGASTRQSCSFATYVRQHYRFCLRCLFPGILTILFASLCCHTLYEFKINQLNQNLTSETSSKSSLCQLLQPKLKLYYQIPGNYISFSLLFVLTVLLIVFENLAQRKSKSSWYHLSFPMIFHPYSHTYRFESAAVFGLLALEILQIVDEFITNGEKHLQNGPLIDLLVMFATGLMLGLRYFPILAVFEQKKIVGHRLKNVLCYGCAAIYLYCEILFKLQVEMRCPNEEKRSVMVQDVLSRHHSAGINLRDYLGKWTWAYLRTRSIELHPLSRHQSNSTLARWSTTNTSGEPHWWRSVRAK